MRQNGGGVSCFVGCIYMYTNAPLGLLVTGRSGAVVVEEVAVEDAAGALAGATALMLVENANSTDTVAVTDRESCVHNCY